MLLWVYIFHICCGARLFSVLSPVAEVLYRIILSLLPLLFSAAKLFSPSCIASLALVCSPALLCYLFSIALCCVLSPVLLYCNETLWSIARSAARVLCGRKNVSLSGEGSGNKGTLRQKRTAALESEILEISVTLLVVMVVVLVVVLQRCGCGFVSLRQTVLAGFERSFSWLRSIDETEITTG